MSFHSWTRRSVLLGLTGLTMTALIVPAGAQRREDKDLGKAVEERLADWKPTKDNDAVPTKQLACLAEDLSGTWEADHSMAGSTIKLLPLGHDHYRVLFATRGCLGQWTLERTATYSNGTLLFDRPVEEYVSLPYRRLFTIQTSNGICLISDFALAFHYENHKGEPTPRFMVFKNKTRTMKK